jgi:hypothetical protein
MTPLTDSGTATDHLHAVVEAVCAAIVTLEAVRADTSDAVLDVCSIHSRISAAVECLRQAVAELRAAMEEDPGVLALGFVQGTASILL